MCRGFESLLRYQNHAVTPGRSGQEFPRYRAAELEPPFPPIRKVALAVERQPTSTPCAGTTSGSGRFPPRFRTSPRIRRASWIASWTSARSPSGSFRMRSGADRHGASESQAFEKLAATGEGETESAEAAASAMPGRSFSGVRKRASRRKRRFAPCRAFSSVDASSQSPPPARKRRMSS